MAMIGARLGAATRFRRLIGGVIAADLAAFVVPGPEIARARGLDLGAAGLRPVPTPRHATVLVVIDPLPEGLARAAAVAYAQMPRPRAILALGIATVSPLPAPDIGAAIEQTALVSAVTALRRLLAEASFSPTATPFEVAAVRTKITYTCPMHPEIVREGPGSCPICGMDLIPREDVGEGMEHGAMAMAHGDVGMAHDPASEVAERGVATIYTCPMHPEIVRARPGTCPLCGMDLVLREDSGAVAHDDLAPAHESAEGAGTAAYTCPMHPEITRDAPGSCPLCGMALVPVGEADGTGGAAGAIPAAHAGHDLVPISDSHDGHGARTSAYTCPMHPEIVREQPGSCPICGMDLVPTVGADTSGTAAGMVPAGHAGHGAGTTPKHADTGSHSRQESGHDEPGRRHGHAEDPSSVSSGTGDAKAATDQGAHDQHADHGAGMVDHDSHGQHAGHGAGMGMPHGMHEMQGMGDTADMDHSAHIQGGFMSMVAMTRDLPRSRDGLPMEWVEAPFGPLFPGLPGGLDLTLTLDGDVVARAALTPGATARNLAATWPGPAVALPDRLTKLDPLTPYTYRVLALRALEAAAGTIVDDATARARIRGLERERVASHLGWLASFGALLGVGWLAARAAALQLALLAPSGPPQPARLDTAIRRLVGGVEQTPLLARRLAGRGCLPGLDVGAWRGPVARASGLASDARMADPAYRALGFVPVTREGADALARLRVRLAEVTQSLELIAAAAAPPAAAAAARSADRPAGHDPATVETPRGAATLQLTLEGDVVRTIRLETPCAAHADLVAAAAEGHELADALVGIASLDLSPWAADR